MELRLSPDPDGGTVLEVEHASVHDVFLNDAQTGMWGVGTGWEIPLVYGLEMYLRGQLPDAPASEWYEPTPEDEEVGPAWARRGRPSSTAPGRVADEEPPAVRS